MLIAVEAAETNVTLAGVAVRIAQTFEESQNNSGSTMSTSLRYADRMASIQPDQAEFLLHVVYLPGLKNEHSLTKSIIGAIPPDKGEYRPDGISRNALDLAWHIAVTEIRFLDAVLAGAFDLTPRPRPDSIANSKDLVRWYSENFDPRFEKLAKLSSQKLLKIVDFRGMFQLPAVMYLGFILHHTVHHRGQLSMYLRPMGAKVPSIYGESFDAAEARKAAQQIAEAAGRVE
jgi:uncharacterized damage-inducible protein DinB